MNVSLLVTSFKRGPLFEKSLPSILPQLTNEDEIVVVNDGPLDSMEQVLKGAMVRNVIDPTGNTFGPIPYKFIDTGNRGYHGCCHAKNVGLKAAKHDLVIINDPEVMHISDCITQLRKYFENPENARKFVVPGSMYFAKDPQNQGFKESNFIGHSQAPFIGAMMKQEAIAVGGWDERFQYWGNDDNDLMHRMGKNGTIHECNEALVAFHQWHDRPPAEAMGDCNESLLYEQDKPIIANQGKEWGVV